jgi:hypothetical protein
VDRTRLKQLLFIIERFGPGFENPPHVDLLLDSIAFVDGDGSPDQFQGMSDGDLLRLIARRTFTYFLTQTTHTPGYIQSLIMNDPDICPALATVYLTSCVGTGSSFLLGRVSTAEGQTGVSTARLALAGPGECRNATTTTARGIYALRGLEQGTHAITPSNIGGTFVPSSRTVEIAGRFGRAVFRATCP